MAQETRTTDHAAPFPRAPRGNCEHIGCRKAGWFGFSDGHDLRWYCTAHKDEGEDECRYERFRCESMTKSENA